MHLIQTMTRNRTTPVAHQTPTVCAGNERHTMVPVKTDYAPHMTIPFRMTVLSTATVRLSQTLSALLRLPLLSEVVQNVSFRKILRAVCQSMQTAMLLYISMTDLGVLASVQLWPNVSFLHSCPALSHLQRVLPAVYWYLSIRTSQPGGRPIFCDIEDFANAPMMFQLRRDSLRQV